MWDIYVNGNFYASALLRHVDSVIQELELHFDYVDECWLSEDRAIYVMVGCE